MIQDLMVAFNQFIDWTAQHRIILLFASCIGLGSAGAWLIAGIPFREHLLDSPNERSSHTVPTPRGGGVGILAAFIVAGLTFRIPTTFLFASVFIASISFYGDYFRISVRFRLMVQCIAALLLLFPMLPRLTTLYAVSSLGYSPVIIFIILPLILLFLIGTANLFNFMDGINGIAGVSGTIAFGMLGAYTLNRPAADAFQNGFSLLSVGISLACLGYLPFNMPRARVFMGDVGSILLGFVFAALVVTLAGDYREMLCFTALLFPFYADELTTMAVRLRDHENLVQSHRRHLYQLLANEAGIDHWKVTLVYGTIQLAIGAGVLIACPYGTRPVMAFLAACFGGFVVWSWLVRKKYPAHSRQSV